MQVRKHMHTNEKPTEPLHKTQSLELWLELQFADAIR